MDPETEENIRLLGEAIQTKDWAAARRQWEWLTTRYPWLLEHGNFRHVSAVLRDEQALVYPHSSSIH